MPATVNIIRKTGSAGAPVRTNIDGSSTRLSTADDPAPGTANPIPIPGAGTNYSFWCAVQLRIGAVAPSNNITNIKWFSDGANGFGTGVTCNGQSATSYVQATGTTGTTGDILNTTNYPTLTAAAVDVFTFTTGSPKSLSGSGNTINTDIGDHFVFQLAIGTTASAGTTPSETCSMRYDET